MKFKWNALPLNILCGLLLSLAIGCASNPDATNVNRGTNSKSESDSLGTGAPYNEPLERENISAIKHQEIRYISKIISDYHLAKPVIDNNMSVKIFTSFIKSLDPHKHHFLQSDINEFSAMQDKFDNMIMTGWLNPIFPIHQRYAEIVEQRLLFAKSVLDDPSVWTPNMKDGTSTTNHDWLSDGAGRQTIWFQTVVSDIHQLKDAQLSVDAIKRILSERYQRNIEQQRSIDTNQVYTIFVNAFLSTLDSRTSYFPPRSSIFNADDDLRQEGVGLVLQAKGAYIQVARVVAGGPADISRNLFENDRLVTIAEAGKEPVNVVGKPLEEVAEMFRGKANTIVQVTGLRGSKPFQVALNRKRVELVEPEVTSLIVDAGQHKIGVLKIPKFYLDFTAKYQGKSDYRSVSRDVRIAMESLNEKNIQGLVIDLAGNGGGALDEVVEAAGVFLGKNPIVQDRSRNGKVDVLSATKTDVAFEKPIVILVDPKTASGSEIFAAAMQDYGKALVVGQLTYGLGTIQRLLDINQQFRSETEEFGALKLTISESYRVTGVGIQHSGVQPDILLNGEADSIVDLVRESDIEYSLPASNIAAAVNASDKLDKIKTQLNQTSGLPTVTLDSNEKLDQKLRDAIQIVNQWISLSN